MEKLPRLPDEHLKRAKEMVARNRKGGRCKLCYDRGYQGISQDNMLVPCSKCVDTDAVLKEWKAFVQATPELAELYGDYYAEDEEEKEKAT
tara:strand:+ start:408 stop:680 length:273 start_codon:yes stop_codon:yes gene_type:complete